MRSSSPRGVRRLARTVIAVVAALGTLTGTALAATAESGVDVSKWQHGTSLDWAAVKADGISFAFIKATEGSSYTNRYFASDWAETRQVGLFHGAYHFARPSVGSAAAQARYYVSVAGKADAAGDLPPVLDLEVTGGLGVAALRTWTANWLSTVEELTGRTPIIYTGPSFWETYLGNSKAFTRYPLWIAHYTNTSPRVPGGWPTWTFWQSTRTGRVSGISGDVDRNTFNGTRSELEALATPPEPVPTEPVPTEPVPTEPVPTEPVPTEPVPTEPVPTEPVPTEPVPTEPTPTEPAPKPSTTTSLVFSSGSVYAGQKVTFSGRLAAEDGKALAGRTVKLHSRRTGQSTWTVAASLVTDAAGRYTTTMPVTAAASYKATFAGGRLYSPSASALGTVKIRPKTDVRLRLSAGRTTVARGRSVRLYGHLTTAAGSALAGRQVQILRRASGSTTWTLVGSATTVAPTGWYQMHVKPRRSTTYKAVVAGQPRFNAARSNLVTVTVR